MTFSNLLLRGPSPLPSKAKKTELGNRFTPEKNSSRRSILLRAIAGCACLILLSQTAVGQTDVRPKNESGVDFSDWILKHPTGAEAEFRMPSRPRYVERTFTPVQNQPPIKVQTHIGSIEKGQLIFTYHDLYKAPQGADVAKTLDGAVSGAVAIVAGRPDDKATRIRYGAYPGRQITYRYAANDKVLKVTSRVIIAGRRQYMVAALMEQDHFDEALAEQFLGSFRIVRPDSDLPPRPSVKAKAPSNG